jgi:hypothetical protein
MDPFIESQAWSDFHLDFLIGVRAALVPRVEPEYVVEVQRYVFLERVDERVDFVPDAVVASADAGWRHFAGSAVATLPAVKNSIPMPDRKGQPFLVIQTTRGRRVVTVIELLSPWNKAPGDGVQQYLQKRVQYCQALVNMVELDLLRGGQRLPTAHALQPGDYYAFISQPRTRPNVDVYAWTLREPLPQLPIPLADEESAVPLDLQAVFAETYHRAGYRSALDYDEPVKPPLNDADEAWVAEILRSRSATASQ